MRHQLEPVTLLSPTTHQAWSNACVSIYANQVPISCWTERVFVAGLYTCFAESFVLSLGHSLYCHVPTNKQ